MKNRLKVTIALILGIILFVVAIGCSDKELADSKNELPDNDQQKEIPATAFWEGYEEVSFIELLQTGFPGAEIRYVEGWKESDILDEKHDLSKGATAYTYDINGTFHFYMELKDGKLKAKGACNRSDDNEIDETAAYDALYTLVLIKEGFLDTPGDLEDSEKIDIAEEQKNPYDYVEEADLGGYEFRMLCRPGMIKDQYVEEQTGDIISDAVYTRNKVVESLLNVKITATVSGESTASDALNTILAGDDQYDVIFPHTRVAFNYAVQDACVNLNDISTINFDAEWWHQDIIDSANVNGHLYVLDGDIQTHGLSYAFTMYFNKRIFDELGLEYPYYMALNGEWTFDEFAKLVKRGSKDLNGDGLMKPDDDQFGYYTWPTFGPIEVLYSGGQRVYAKNAKGVPTLAVNSPKTVDIFSKYFSLCNTEDVYLKKSSETVREDLFTAGRAMFADKGLGNAKTMRNMTDDFGILPWPKFTAEDEYATAVNGHASLLIVPVTVEDPDKTGQVLEALCAVGHHEVIPAFYEVSLKTKFARDMESEAMIDIIRDSLIYDLGYISGNSIQGIGEMLANMSNPDFASYYAANEAKAITDLDRFLKSYGKVA